MKLSEPEFCENQFSLTAARITILYCKHDILSSHAHTYTQARTRTYTHTHTHTHIYINKMMGAWLIQKQSTQKPVQCDVTYMEPTGWRRPAVKWRKQFCAYIWFTLSDLVAQTIISYKSISIQNMLYSI